MSSCVCFKGLLGRLQSGRDPEQSSCSDAGAQLGSHVLEQVNSGNCAVCVDRDDTEAP